MSRKGKPAPPNASRLSDLFADAGPLASRKSGYGYRPQQLVFARAVEKTFKERGVLLADAPTGTGKSAAYLAPAILDVASSGGRVVVSTATLALQAQLLSEDLPLMRAAAAELMGHPEEESVTYAVLKGHSNFLCVRRHQDTLRAGTILDADLLSYLEELQQVFTTDRATSNGPTEAINLLIETSRRAGHGFRNFDNYRLRLLLAHGHTSCDHCAPRMRRPHPRFAA